MEINRMGCELSQWAAKYAVHFCFNDMTIAEMHERNMSGV